MSIDFHVHVGPVLVCKFHHNEAIAKKTVTVSRCTNGHKSNGKFCSQCGTPITQYQEEKVSSKREKSVTNIYDMLSDGGFREDTFDACWGGLNNEKLIDSHDVFAPASAGFEKLLGRKLTITARDFNLHHLGNIDTKAEIAKMEEFFASEIAYLRTQYDAVTVDWAILTNGR